MLGAGNAVAAAAKPLRRRGEPRRHARRYWPLLHQLEP